ncbi:hypothetical protein ACU4GD_12265 [Cupriavidus basilensis]
MMEIAYAGRVRRRKRLALFAAGRAAELARVLTGLGINARRPAAEAAAARSRRLYHAPMAYSSSIRPGMIPGPKTPLGHRIEPTGFHEVEQAVD